KEAAIARFLIGEEQYRGQGVGKKALNQLVRIGFEQFGLESILLNVFDHNKQAIRCYESIGFRKSHYHENKYQDSKGIWWSSYEMTLRKADCSSIVDGL